MSDNLSDKILMWLAEGETGQSSVAMAFAAIDKPCKTDYPHDPGDFYRCLKLVEQVPEIKDQFHKVAEINSFWRKIIENWDTLSDLLNEEIKEDTGRAPRTYKLIKKLYKQILEEI